MKTTVRKMLQSGMLSPVMLCLALGVTPMALADTFTSIDFPRATLTAAYGINPRGDIVGRYADAAGVIHAYLLRDGDFTSFDFPGATLTAALGINPRGDIVGRYIDADAVTHGYLLRAERFTSIDFPGAIQTELWGINPRGDIVGLYVDAGGVTHGFLRSKEHRQRGDDADDQNGHHDND